MKVQQAFRLEEELVEKLKASAKANYRNLTQEVEMRLELSFKNEMAAASDQTPATVDGLTRHEQNTK